MTARRAAELLIDEAWRFQREDRYADMLRAAQGAVEAARTWVHSSFPEPPMFGRTPAEKAEVASWHCRVEFEGLMAVGEALRNGSPAMAGRALPGPVDFARIVRVKPGEQHAHLRRWRAAMALRPAMTR